MSRYRAALKKADEARAKADRAKPGAFKRGQIHVSVTHAGDAVFGFESGPGGAVAGVAEVLKVPAQDVAALGRYFADTFGVETEEGQLVAQMQEMSDLARAAREDMARSRKCLMGARAVLRAVSEGAVKDSRLLRSVASFFLTAFDRDIGEATPDEVLEAEKPVLDYLAGLDVEVPADAPPAESEPAGVTSSTP